MSPATPRAQMTRAAAWAGILLLPMIRHALYLADLTPRQESVLSDVLVYLIPIFLVTVVASIITAQTLGLLEHWLWGAVAIGTVCILLGEAHWSWYTATVDFHGPPMDSPVRLLYVFALLAHVALFSRMIGFSRQPLAARLRGLADAFGSMVYLYGLVYGYWALSAFEGLPSPLRNAAQLSLYPVVGVAMLIFIVWLVFGWESRRWHVWQTLLAGSYILYAIGLVFFTFSYPKALAATEFRPDFTSMFLGMGMYLLFVAGVYRLTSGDGAAIEHPLHLRRRRLAWQFFPALLATGLPLLSWRSHELGGRAAIPVAACALLLALALAVRSWASALEFAQHRVRAITDTLTGAHNNRYLHRRLPEMLESAVETDVVVSVVLFDVDGFRCLNNSYGHHAGDTVLRSLVEVAAGQLPPLCELFRAGGDEFVAVLPQHDTEKALSLVGTIRAEALRRVSPNGVTPVGVSFGIAEFPVHALDARTLIACARAAERSVDHADPSAIRVFDPATMVAAVPRGVEEDIRARSLRDTVRALAAAVDARDTATRHHSTNVAELAASLAISLGLPAERVDLITLAAQMHDLGKIGIADGILLKSDALSDEERRVMEEHPTLGARILAAANMQDLMPIVSAHHERWDGMGYPDGIAGYDICLEARILAVCDSYEALVAGRPYRPACDPALALSEIEAASGTQFDPIVVSAFVTMLRQGRRAVRPAPLSAIEVQPATS